jgi:ABC-type nitrate/sulfonate/bicarbonate transport system ATPase subunit/ABC-type transporter Mla maintaining outer membrane lipid asymmetry permease subunit MlaE
MSGVPETIFCSSCGKPHRNDDKFCESCGAPLESEIIATNAWIVGSGGGSDIIVKGETVSSRHCRVTALPDGFLIEDLKSTNGTFVNGRIIDRPTHVKEGDPVTLGIIVPLPWSALSPLHGRSLRPALGHQPDPSVEQEGHRALPSEPVLQITNLSLKLPNGKTLFDKFSLTLLPGEIIVILGGSGAGKSTLARVLFEEEDLRNQGFSLSSREMRTQGELGLVPQRGAALDHLDVAGNIEIALRHSIDSPQRVMSVEDWLQAVDLPLDLSKKGTPVARLSGGQAQRLAVARTLASGRRILFLDEPSVGLDPLRVLRLGDLIRAQSIRSKVSMLVVTHDIQFACHVADRLLFLDPQTRNLVPVLEGVWNGPFADPNTNESLEVRGRVEKEVLALLAKDPPSLSGNSTPHQSLTAVLKGIKSIFSSFVVPSASLLYLPDVLRKYLPDIRHVLSRVLKNAVLRPLPFYLIVSVLLGYTILYVIGKAMPTGLRVTKAVELVGGSYILALTPPISAFLFVATSGSAINAWLGSMGLTRQTMALEALGIRREKYLWVPSWFGMTLAFLVVALVFGAGMVLGGVWQSYQSGIDNPWPILLGDIIDPEPSRVTLRSRAFWLVGIYAAGIASDVVYRGTTRKDQADDVTRGMTGSVVACTLWVVFLELITAVFIFPR